MLAVLELGALSRRMQPALVMAALEVVAMIVVTPVKVVALVTPRLAPARGRRVALELEGPWVRSDVPVRRMVTVDELRTVTQDDAKVERRHQIGVYRAVPVRRSRRRQDGNGTERGGE